MTTTGAGPATGDAEASAPGPDIDGLPRLPRVYVPRGVLWERLDATTRAPVTLLVGPVGAGKTLGVGGWLHHRGLGESTRWLHGDPSWTADHLRSTLMQTWQETTSDEGDVRPRTLVVIDDAHRLPSVSLRLLDRMLGERPESMRLLLISRWDLPITRLGPELLGHFSVLRGGLLRLDDTESAQLIAGHAGTSDPEVARLVAHQAQGWCAAVVLAARALATAADPRAAAERLGTDGAPLVDRVADEVFASLSERERHLLLCVSTEETVSAATAAHLSGDPRAAETLADLETTGLLVSRLPGGGGTPARMEPRDLLEDADGRYRIHPLLAEVVRRRFAAGGADVQQARAAVLRAVRLDLARGDHDDAFLRLVGLGEAEEATRVLAEDGTPLLMHGHGPAVHSFARHHRAAVDAAPDAWFTLATERWYVDDTREALHWLERLIDAAPAGDPAFDAQVASARLMRSRLGHESMTAAVGNARRLLLLEQGNRALRPVLPRLLIDVGISQTWLGELADAEVNLTRAIRLARTQGLPVMVVTALTHLAWTEYARGHERACVDLATEALTMINGMPGWRPRFAAPRALLARQLGALADLPWPDGPTTIEATGGPVHSSDLTTRFWARMRDARLALAAGSVAAAERILQVPGSVPSLPEHLQVTELVERGFLACLAGDRLGLEDVTGQLDRRGARGEAMLLHGLGLDLGGDVAGAASALAAAASDTAYAQPPSRALALTCAAQLNDALGRSGLARDQLAAAVVTTEARRNAVPFLGWARHGTPVHELLARLTPAVAGSWLAELTEATVGRPGMVAVLGPRTPTQHEREVVREDVIRGSLSPRERDVLLELARGATYADIAGTLFVSETTVKTHVSSLYSKLGVNRRSEALAAARSLGLL